MNVLIEKTEVVQDELHIETRKDYKQLKSDMKGQKDENEMLYKGLKIIVQSTESQKRKIAIYQAKVEELEQHVGILGNSPDPHFTSMQYLGPVTISAAYTQNMASNEGLWDEQPVGPIRVEKEMTKRNSQINNSDVNLRGGSSMDEFIKKTEEKAVPFMMQSSTLVPVTNAVLSPGMNRDDQQNRSIITLENADLQVASYENIQQMDEADEKMSSV